MTTDQVQLAAPHPTSSLPHSSQCQGGTFNPIIILILIMIIIVLIIIIVIVSSFQLVALPCGSGSEEWHTDRHTAPINIMYKSSSSSSSSSYETLTLPSLSSLSSYILNYSHFDTNYNQWFCITGCWTVARVSGPTQRASSPWYIPGIPQPHILISSFHHITIIS